MINPISPIEKLLFATVRIETTLERGESSVGSGFFFDFRLDKDKVLPLIVTNKHVIKGATNGRFLLHEAEEVGDGTQPSGRFIPVDIKNFEKEWIAHPDPSVDLCAMLFQPLRELAKRKRKNIFNIKFDEMLIFTQQQTEQLNAVEDVLMVGYPNGLWDSTNNLPLIRRGITSSHPALNFCDNAEFVVDIACFPGSSGSPVLLSNQGSYHNKTGGLTVGSRLALLGVLYAGPVMSGEGKIIVEPIPTVSTPLSKTDMMIHLGYSIHASEIMKLGEHVKTILSRDGRLN